MPAPEYFDPCDDLYADLIDRKIGRRTLYLVQREEPEDLIA